MPASKWQSPRSWSHTHRWVECEHGELIVRRLVCLGVACTRHGAGEIVEEVFLDRATRRIVGLGQSPSPRSR
jgi:hypothetical protein